MLKLHFSRQNVDLHPSSLICKATKLVEELVAELVAKFVAELVAEFVDISSSQITFEASI